MLNHKPIATAMGGLVIAAIVLGACSSPTASVPATAPGVIAPTPRAVPPTAAPASLKSKDPTTLVYESLQGDPQTLDPAFDYETAGSSVIQNTYDTLIFYDREKADQFIPQLATEVPSQANAGISANGKTYTFKIRAGVKFHNGDPLTPGDVAFTFQRGLLQGGPDSPQWLLFQPILGLAASPSGNNDITDLVDPSGALIDPSGTPGANRANRLKADPAKLMAACTAVISAIVADDAAGTITFHLAQPWGPFLASIANAWGSISDKKWIGANGGWDGDCKTWQNFYNPDPADLNKSKLGSGENGTGPYVLDHWTPKKDIVLKAFDGYWRTEPAWAGGPTGAPKLKTILIKTVAQFANRLAALRAGDADFIDPGSPADWTQMDMLVGEVCDAAGACLPAATPANPLRVFKGLTSISRQDMFFNFKIDTTGGNDFIGSGKLDGDGISPDFFNDLHVRKAFNYCFDWAAYIKTIQSGEGIQSYDVMLPGEIGTSAQDPHYSYDPGKCKAEFQLSALKGPNGQSLWDTGFRMSFAYRTEDVNGRIMGQILSQDIQAVNPRFVVEATGLPVPTARAALRAGKLTILILAWGEDIHDPHNWVVPYVRGLYAQLQSLPDNLVKTLGDFVNRGVLETDPAKRAAIYKQFNQAYYDAAPTILLAVTQNRHYEQRWVQGYYYNPIYSSFYFYALSKQ